MMLAVRGPGAESGGIAGRGAEAPSTAECMRLCAEYKWLFDLLTDPTLTRYDPAQRPRVALLIGYSGKRGKPGVLEQTDGHLCNAIGMGRKLAQFRRLLDRMIEYNDLREIEVEGKRRYEISRDLVPAYIGDARLTDLWDAPQPRLTVRDGTVHPLADAPTEGKRGGNRKWEIEATDAEKVAFSRYCAAERVSAEREGRPPAQISRDKWMVWYRERKTGNGVALRSDVTFETPDLAVTFDQSKSYNPVTSVTFGSRDDVVDSLLTEEKLQQQRTGEAKVTSNVTKVTETKVIGSKVTDGEPLTPEQQEVYAYLTGKGLWQEVARPAALWCDLLTAHLYTAWVRSLKPTDFGKMLRYQIENRHPIPDDFRKAYDRQKRDAQRQEQRQREAQGKQAQVNAIRERIDAYWTAHSEDERAALLYRAANNLHTEGRRWWKDYLKRRAVQRDLAPMKLLQVALDTELHRLLHDLLELPPYDKMQSVIPERFVMPPEWDGLLPEPGELPEGLGIPNLHTEQGSQHTEEGR